MPDQHDVLFSEASASVVRNVDTILHDLVECHIRCRLATTSKRFSGTALIPLDNREVAFPCTIECSKRAVRNTGAAVDDNDDGICSTRAVDAHPLVNAANGNE